MRRDLVPPGDPAALARAIAQALRRSWTRKRADALRLQARVRSSFSADAMTEAVLDAYRDALSAPQWLRNSRIFVRFPKHFLKLFR